MATQAKRKDFGSLGVLDLRRNTADTLTQTFRPMGPQRTFLVNHLLIVTLC